MHTRYLADPENKRAVKRQRYSHSPERASRSAKRVKVTQKYVVRLQPPSHIKMDLKQVNIKHSL